MTEKNKGQLDELQLVIFTLGDEEFGVDISKVLEIIKLCEITEVPEAPDYVNGIINLRGKIVTVIDLRKKLHRMATEPTNDTRIMIVNVHDNTIGMIVDSVTEVMRLAKENVSPPPNDLMTKVHKDFIEGVGKVGKRLILLLNIEGVLLGEDTEKNVKTEEKTN